METERKLYDPDRTRDGHGLRRTDLRPRAVLRRHRLLEEKALTFRGDTRLAIPLAIIARDRRRTMARLAFRRAAASWCWSSGAAAKWARRMTSPPSRLEKLGVKAGMRSRPGRRSTIAALVEDSESRGAAIASSARVAALDLIFFARTSAPPISHQLGRRSPRGFEPAGAIRLVRAKGRQARADHGGASRWPPRKRAGLVDVKVVSYSDTPQRREIRHSRRQRRGDRKGVRWN